MVKKCSYLHLNYYHGDSDGDEDYVVIGFEGLRSGVRVSLKGKWCGDMLVEEEMTYGDNVVVMWFWKFEEQQREGGQKGMVWLWHACGGGGGKNEKWCWCYNKVSWEESEREIKREWDNNGREFEFVRDWKQFHQTGYLLKLI